MEVFEFYYLNLEFQEFHFYHLVLLAAMKEAE
ncbi:Uncharacterised protein [Chlamydia abortus]|nr:Uncharacterised protein [Chlamydia abortus]